MMEKYREAAEFIRERTDFEPEIALVLGSGLGGFSKNVEIVCEIGYEAKFNYKYNKWTNINYVLSFSY